MERLLNGTFFQENSLQKRVLVTEHQTLICRAAVTLLKRLERLLIVFDGGLELLDIFRPPFTKRGLRLSVSLLSFFRRGIYLQPASELAIRSQETDRASIQVFFLLYVSVSEWHLGQQLLHRVPAWKPMNCTSLHGWVRISGLPYPCGSHP